MITKENQAKSGIAKNYPTSQSMSSSVNNSSKKAHDCGKYSLLEIPHLIPGKLKVN
ncbi:hypothetical protein [Paenibacillus donghaensis]|uniref:hypothetical protein n=1 Tax=Paenibacillus donghaensis TaxID=414771 RepID=UPI0012FD6F64|nr:hypothetical protein [Paenibacillus donghaensis]